MNKFLTLTASILSFSASAVATEVNVPAGGWVTIGITAPSGAVITIDSSGEIVDPPPPPQVEQTLPILINAGGTDYLDASGRLWISDSSFATGGSVVNRGAISIDRTAADFVYQTERWGKASFAVPLKPGRYDVRFHYAETYNNGPGRNTGAIAEGRSLDPADPYMLAGGARKAITRTLRDVSVQDNTLNISLTGKSPMLNGIEIAQANSLPADDVFTPPPVVPPSDDNNGTPSDPPITQSDQCDQSNIPGLARERGFNKLAFCEDFSDPRRINLTSTSLGVGQTMVQNHIFNAKLNPPDRFQFSEGVLTMRPINSNYQGHLITTEKGGRKGFQLRQSGWYVEARMRHLGDYTNWPGCTAFWSMDTDHLYGTQTGPMYAEPDFFEWINGNIRALHVWVRGGGKKYYKSEQASLGKNFDPKKWFTAGALMEADYSAYRWHRDGKVEASKSPSWLREVFEQFNGPIIIGSGSACPIQVDYIRAWSK